MEKIRFQGTESTSQRKIVRVISEVSDRTVISFLDLREIEFKENEQVILRRPTDTVVTKVIMQSKEKTITVYFSGVAYVMNESGETVDTMKA